MVGHAGQLNGKNSHDRTHQFGGFDWLKQKAVLTGHAHKQVAVRHPTSKDALRQSMPICLWQPLRAQVTIARGEQHTK